MEAGVGLVLLPAPYTKIGKVEPVRTAKALSGSTDEWPRSELWLVGNRVLRDVPRVAAMWSFLAEEMRALHGETAAGSTASRRARS